MPAHLPTVLASTAVLGTAVPPVRKLPVATLGSGLVVIRLLGISTSFLCQSGPRGWFKATFRAVVAAAPKHGRGVNSCVQSRHQVPGNFRMLFLHHGTAIGPEIRTALLNPDSPSMEGSVAVAVLVTYFRRRGWWLSLRHSRQGATMQTAGRGQTDFRKQHRMFAKGPLQMCIHEISVAQRRPQNLDPSAALGNRDLRHTFPPFAAREIRTSLSRAGGWWPPLFQNRVHAPRYWHGSKDTCFWNARRLLIVARCRSHAP